jgi:hypothetical protein
LRVKVAARPEDKELIAMIVFQLMAVIAALALGFVLGRIWEIRREIRRHLASP